MTLKRCNQETDHLPSNLQILTPDLNFADNALVSMTKSGTPDSIRLTGVVVGDSRGGFCYRTLVKVGVYSCVHCGEFCVGMNNFKSFSRLVQWLRSCVQMALSDICVHIQFGFFFFFFFFRICRINFSTRNEFHRTRQAVWSLHSSLDSAWVMNFTHKTVSWSSSRSDKDHQGSLGSRRKHASGWWGTWHGLGQ